jgi:Skp family chaperone for outer membrane proteins
MFQMLSTAAAAAWCAVAGDAIVETIQAPGTAIRAFGRSIALTGARTELIVLTLLGLSVGVILAMAGTFLIGVVRTGSLRRELARRDEERRMAEAKIAAKNDLLAWRVDELQQQADTLLAKRDELMDELSEVSATTQELRTKAKRSRETLQRLSKELVVMPDLEQQQNEAG